MTKKMKKLLSLMLAVVMVLAMSVTTFAATVKVEDNGPSEHTYKAYQILSGTQEEGSKVLGDVKWATGINADNFLAALKADTTEIKAAEGDTPAVTIASLFKDVTDAKGFAQALSAYSNDSTAAKKVAQIAYKNKATGTAISKDTTSLADGYYLIVDETTLKDDADDALNAALLQVTGDDVVIANKTDKPSVEKKVQENVKADSETEYGKAYNDVADYNIGDAVPFKIIGTVPDTTNYEKYTTYTFTDTLDKGFDAPANTDVKVFYATDKAALEGTDLSAYFNVAVDGQKITVSLKENQDLKNIPNIEAGKYIIVTYSATLNSDAEIGLPGNENKVDLTYTNEPNVESDGTPGTGKTPEDKVIVFTYELDTTKVDADNKETKLPDAEFVLYKEVEGKKQYVIVDADSKVTEWTETKEKSEDDGDDVKAASVLKSNASGLFSVIGLDDGTYYLEETKAPKGYNLLSDPIKVVISATSKDKENMTTQKWSEVPADALVNLDVTANNTTSTGTVADGKVAISVENNSGSTLPETGGIGTTIFYIVGIALMAAAAALTFRRRRA